MTGMFPALASLSLLVGVVLALSGASKVRDPQSLVAAMGQLRVPVKLTGKTVRHIVTWGELGLASIVLFTHGAILVLGWTAILVLFLIYLALVVRAARQPEPVSCNCFGASAAPVTNRTIARNVLLAACAAVGWIGALFGANEEGVLPAVLGANAGLAIFILGLTATTTFVLGLDLGSATGVDPRPGASGASYSLAAGTTLGERPGEALTEGVDSEYARRRIPVAVVERDGGKTQLLSELADDRAVVLLYLSPTCSPCLEIVGKLPQWAEQLGALDFVVVAYSQFDVTQLRSRIQGSAVIDVAGSVQQALNMDAVPSAAILGTDGLLAGGPVIGTEDIAQMMEQLVEEFASAHTAGSEHIGPAT